MAVVAAIGASSYLNLDQGDLEQDTAIQAGLRLDWIAAVREIIHSQEGLQSSVGVQK